MCRLSAIWTLVRPPGDEMQYAYLALREFHKTSSARADSLGTSIGPGQLCPEAASSEHRPALPDSWLVKTLI